MQANDMGDARRVDGGGTDAQRRSKAHVVYWSIAW
jgi:hypothetical protein